MGDVGGEQPPSARAPNVALEAESRAEGVCVFSSRSSFSWINHTMKNYVLNRSE